MFTNVAVSILDGLLAGAVYGLAAMGLTLVWGAVRVVNLVHGTMIAGGMFALYFVSALIGDHPYLALPLVAVLGFLGGIALYWVAIHRVAKEAALMSLLATFAVDMILIGIGTAVWGTAVFNVEVQLPGLTWGRYTFSGTHLLAAFLAIVVTGLLYAFLYHTRLGKAIRAVAADRDAAAFCGISPTAMLALVVGLGGALAGISGGLIATMLPFTVLSGSEYLFKSFVVTVLGGMGNPSGALLGGLTLGLIEGVATPFIPVSWVPVVEFTLFVVILIAAPQGAFNFRKR